MTARAWVSGLAHRAQSRIDTVSRWFRSPLVRFVPLSVLTLVAIGFSVHMLTANLITDRAHQRATRDAQLFANYVVAPVFANRPAGPLDGPAIEQVDAALGVNRPTSELSAITLLNADGTVLWADDPAAIGHHRVPSTSFGSSNSRVLADRVTFEISVPLRRGGEVFATMQAHTPYRPIADGLAGDIRELTILLVGGLLVLYAVLVPVVMKAHRRLHRHASAQEHLAVHDALTGLANRALLREEATRALARSRRRETHLALLVIDLDKFKEVNDTLGHHTGDVLLKQVAERMNSVVRDSDLLARLGGDEFAILAEDIGRPEYTKILAERLLQALLEPFVIDDMSLDVGASIGAAVYPSDGEDFDTLMHHADIAMYRAKEIRNAYALYHPSQDGLEPERLTLVSTLRAALDSNQIVLHYQPKIDIDSGRIVGAEALARWDHPQRGCLLPGEFLDAVDAAGLMPILCDYVLDRALGQCRTWLDSGLLVPVSVNISARSLDDLHLYDMVAASLAKWRLPAAYLELELSETTVMNDVERRSPTLARLAGLGVHLAIDEFGSGYSSLTRLQGLPVSTIKIDRSFLSGIEHDEHHRGIVRAAINLAHDMGYTAIAVGVESADAWRMMQALHCDAAQGYFFARPQPAALLEPLLREHCPTEALAARY
jgi:diguanylate cyclase (GGDEF)-like protein